jgi:hypothetical protein
MYRRKMEENEKICVSEPGSVLNGTESDGGKVRLREAEEWARCSSKTWRQQP